MGRGAGGGGRSRGALSSFEDRIKGNSSESAGVFDKNGKLLFQKEGTEFSVGDFSQSEKDKLKGSTLTHNHPSGNSFSEKDIEVLSEYGIKEIRAVSDKYTYSLSIPKGSKKDTIDLLYSYRQISDRKVMERYLQTNKTDYTDFTHEIMLEFAKENGLNYSRK